MEEHSNGASASSSEARVWPWLHYERIALLLEIRDTCAHRVFSIAFEMAKSNCMALWGS